MTIRNAWLAILAVLVTVVPPGRASALPNSTIEAIIRKETQAGFSGVVIVADGKSPLLAKASGRIKNVPVKLRSRFWISSTGKQFVSAAVFKLRDEGRLSLNDTLARWLPDVPTDKRAITLRHLLTHTSGLPQGYIGEGAHDNVSAVQGILALNQEANPGAKFIYSNENFYLAAAIVERITQKPFRLYEEETFFHPLSMGETGVARGPAGVLPTKEKTPERLTRSRWGISGHYSSAEDMVRWYQALQSGSVLSRRTVDEMWKPAVKIGEGEAAAGWFITITERGTRRVWTRGNDDYGANSLIYGYPERDLVIVVLTHAGDKPGGMSWSREMVTRLEKTLAL